MEFWLYHVILSLLLVLFASFLQRLYFCLQWCNLNLQFSFKVTTLLTRFQQLVLKANALEQCQENM